MALIDLLISPAFAQAAGEAPSPLASFAPIILLFFIFYFLVIRPQNKKMKAHREMVANTQKGDEVITAGGIYGKVTKVHAVAEGEQGKVSLRIAEGVEVFVQQNTISQVLTKREHVAEVKTDTPAKKAANDNK